MDYKLSINNEPCPVTVEKTGEIVFTADIDGIEYRVEGSRLSDNRLLLTVNGRQVTVGLVESAEGAQVLLRGQTYEVVDEDLLAQAGPARQKRKKAQTEVAAPTPAVVVSIAVSEGDTVSEGQAVAVVSAMKMETTLYAPFDGVVTAVNVAAGDKVMPGQVLVDIDKQASAEADDDK
ncbi:MAG: biotin/lipoyl-containing protein [Desulfosudaceae bacterium]